MATLYALSPSTRAHFTPYLKPLDSPAMLADQICRLFFTLYILTASAAADAADAMLST